MARTTLTKSTVLGTNTYAGVALTMTAADVANMNQFVAGGKDLLVIHNTGGSDYTYTVTSTADERGRTKDITTETVTAGTYKVVGPLELTGWVQSDGKIYIAASNAAIKFGIVALPG